MPRVIELPGQSGASLERSQWESGNASVRFPFADDSGPEDYPFDVIVDACVVLPSEEFPSESRVYVGCLHIGPGMASAMVYADGEPILHCRVLKDSFEAFSPVVMEAVRPGCSGVMSFGDIRFDDYSSPITRREMVPLAESVVMRPVVGRLRKFVQPERGEEASGIVGIVVPDGVGMSMSEAGDSSVISFSMDDAIRQTVMVRCNPVETPLSMPMPISSVNGVQPDSQGRLAIVFAHDLKEVPA